MLGTQRRDEGGQVGGQIVPQEDYNVVLGQLLDVDQENLCGSYFRNCVTKFYTLLKIFVLFSKELVTIGKIF